MEAPKQLCSKAHEDLRHRVQFQDCSVQGQELDVVILVGSFKLRTFCGSVMCVRTHCVNIQV